MANKNLTNLVETSSSVWANSKITGVHYLALNTDQDQKCGTFIYRLAPKTTFPKHRHFSSEEMFILKGDLTVGTYELKSGDFLYSPIGTIHEASTKTGCVFMMTTSKPIQIVPDGRHEEIEASTEEVATGPGTADGGTSLHEFDPATLEAETTPGATSEESEAILKEFDKDFS